MYIHERENWWQFMYDEKRVGEALEDVRRKQEEILGLMSALGYEEMQETIVDNISLDIVCSSEIEGEILHSVTVRSSVARRLGIDDGGVAESRYIEGVVDMAMDAMQNCEKSLTDERLFGWHNTLFPNGRSGMYIIEVAKYRSGEMQVVSGAMGKEKVHYQAPKPERVQEEMGRFMEWVNNDGENDLILKSAIAHFWFVCIHPFDDGNGRIGRVISDMLLARADGSKRRYYSMSDAICRNRKGYYDVLERLQKGEGEITEWILWFLNCMDDAIEKTRRTVETVVMMRRFWKKNEGVELNERQRKIINMMLEGFDGNLTIARWSRICDCARATAQKDADYLTEKGIMRKEEKGKNVRYLINDMEN